jgi:RHS repeat-associated protein
VVVHVGRDAENRLLAMETLTNVLTTARARVTWDYDPAGRRLRQAVATNWTGSAYGVTNETRYLYDGWACVAELNAVNGLLRQYAWGLDLSGTTTGAGGVGGLLWVRPAGGPAHFAACDGNGNVVGLVDGSTGTVSARYDYDPFGTTLRMTGPMARENSFRFSTKRADDTTGIVLYEYRPYAPALGRWPNRDPIGEKGGANLYGFVVNGPVSRSDPYGRESFEMLQGVTYDNPSPYETDCDLWIQRDREFPGHEILVGIGTANNPSLRPGRHFRGKTWAILIPEPGKWGDAIAPIKNDFKDYVYSRVARVKSGELAAGRARGGSCSCLGTCVSIRSCLEAVTAPGTTSPFHGLACYGDNCRTAIDAALAKCCLQRGALFYQGP